MTAIMMPVFLAVIGGAIDFGHAQQTKALLQSAADTAVLAAVSYSGATYEQRRERADAVFDHNVSPRIGEIEKALVARDREYEYKASARIETTFLKIVDIDAIDVTAVSRALDDTVPLDVALVLDVSGSMEQGTQRLVELKKAVKKFLASFDPQVNDIQAAIVPFNGQVRVDPATASNPDFDTPPNPYVTNECDRIGDPLDRRACEAGSFARTRFDFCGQIAGRSDYGSFRTDGNANDRSNCGPDKPGFALRPDFYRNETYGTHTSKGRTYEYHGFMLDGVRMIDRRDCTDGCRDWKTIFLQKWPTVPTNLSIELLRVPWQDWDGCVLDRTQPFDARADAPTAAARSTLYPKAACTNADTLKAVLPLSKNLELVDDYAQALKANGGTNVTIGLQWGMESLTASSPMVGARANAKKIIILLTDGENFHNRWEKDWDGSREERVRRMNARTLAACASAKGAGIDLYTVNLIGGDEKLLKSCASEGETYYSAVDDAAELGDTFEGLARNIKTIRLSF